MSYATLHDFELIFMGDVYLDLNLFLFVCNFSIFWITYWIKKKSFLLFCYTDHNLVKASKQLSMLTTLVSGPICFIG